MWVDFVVFYDLEVFYFEGFVVGECGVYWVCVDVEWFLIFVCFVLC